MSWNPSPPFTGVKTFAIDGARATYGYFTAASADGTIHIYENGAALLGRIASAELAALVTGFDETGCWPTGHLGAFLVTGDSLERVEASARALLRHVQDEWRLYLEDAPTLRVSPGCDVWPGPAVNALVVALLAHVPTSLPTVLGLYFTHPVTKRLNASGRVGSQALS